MSMWFELHVNMPSVLWVYACISKIQIGFTFLVPAHPGSPGQRADKRVYVQVFLDNGKVDRLLLLCPRLRSRVLWRACLSVCMCVCVRLSVRDHIFGTTRPIFTQFFVHVNYGRGSVLLWHCSDEVCTSVFMDDVIFAHKPRLLDVAT